MTAPRETLPAMPRILCCLIAAALPGCHGMFGARTTEEDVALSNFADARERAATYYDGRDYYRAAAQYKVALEYRPDHTASRLGYAYSLMFTDLPSNLVRAEEEFEDIGKLGDPRDEVKRIYGLALTHRTLAKHFGVRARIHDQKARVKLKEEDLARCHEHARKALDLFDEVFKIDEALAKKQAVAPLRVTGSLVADTHAGMAHCEIMLVDRTRTEHLDRAIEHIDAYAKVAKNARRFWEQRRERLLVTDPLREGQEGDPATATLGAEQKARYEERIRRTIQKEVAMRRALVDTYTYLNRFRDAIRECDKIVDLDPGADETYFIRGRAFALLDPPDYRSALADLREYRKRMPSDRLTEEHVGLNRRIRDYEKKLADQEAKSGG